MKIKLKDSELRVFIRDEILKEARMSKRRMSGERIQIKGCDFKETLRAFRTSKGVPVFDKKQIEGLNRMLGFGIPVGGCEVIKLGLFGVAKLLGLSAEGSSGSAKFKINIKDLKRKAMKDTATINDTFGKVTHVHFPNTMDAIHNQKPLSVIVRGMEEDKSNLSNNLDMLNELSSKDIASIDDYLRILGTVASIFKFDDMEEYKKEYDLYDNQTRETLEKFKPDARESTIKTAYNQLVDQDINFLLRDDLKTIYKDFESNSENNADLKSAFDEIKPWFINNELD